MLLIEHDKNTSEHVIIGKDGPTPSNGLRIGFDDSRDGFVIEQASVYAGTSGDQGWVEVAFVPALNHKIEVPDELAADFEPGAGDEKGARS